MAFFFKKNFGLLASNRRAEVPQSVLETINLLSCDVHFKLLLNN